MAETSLGVVVKDALVFETLISEARCVLGFKPGHLWRGVLGLWLKRASGL